MSVRLILCHGLTDGRRSSYSFAKITYYYYYYYYYLVCEAIGTAATPGLLCQPRVTVRMIVEKQMECRLAGGTEILGENLPQRHFCPSKNPTLPDPGLNPGSRDGKPATNRLSYGAAKDHLCIVAYLLKARAVVPENQPLLGNGCVTRNN
jgi:hypothetical protein